MTATIRTEKREEGQKRPRYLVYLDNIYATSFGTRKKAEEWIAEHRKWAAENP